MNSLYTSGVRQTNSIQSDLERLRNGDNSPSLLGQISASLAAMHRTIDDYDSMAKREMIKAKQEKGQLRVQKFRADYSEMRIQFDKHSTTVYYHSCTFHTESELVSESPFRNPNFTSREQHALNEHSFIHNTEARLDEFLAQGTLVLNDLVDQRTMLKGTQRRLLDAANTLGLSRNVIGWIERRSTQDMYIFIAGAIFTFFCFYLIWHYLG
ncbi:V-snare-domain-containing protein [Hymenopellis radicata]|nr:V-snare-domain-containing protein [Hymenopellis radicata]